MGESTRATYHCAIRAWCLWLVRTGRRPDDPTLIATTPMVPKGRPRPVADEHLAVLLSSKMSGRTQAMILLAAYAGLRVSEIASIRGEQVDLITHTIAITGKGDKTRYIPLHPVLQQLAARSKVASPGQPEPLRCTGSRPGRPRTTVGGGGCPRAPEDFCVARCRDVQVRVGRFIGLRADGGPSLSCRRRR